jgi:hypothetical protein
MGLADIHHPSCPPALRATPELSGNRRPECQYVSHGASLTSSTGDANQFTELEVFFLFIRILSAS